MKDIPEMRCAGKIFSSQCFYHWVDTSAGELLVPEGTTILVVICNDCIGICRPTYHAIRNMTAPEDLVK
jgi:hypothetical protein